MILAALSSKWPLQLAAYSFMKSTANELALLPQPLTQVREATKAYVKRHS